MKSQKQEKTAQQGPSTDTNNTGSGKAEPVWPREVGARKGPEPTRYGDWEKSGRCIDF